MGDLGVLIDATAVPGNRGGPGRYVDSLVAALHAEGARLTVVCQRRDGARFTQLAPDARVVDVGWPVELSRPVRLTWEQLRLPALVRRLGAEVVHSPHYTMPLRSSATSVVTLHDATFFTDPQLHSPIKARFFRAWTTTSLRRADRCVVPSAATLTELAAVTSVDRDRVDVVHHGVDTRRFHPPSADQVRAARKAIGVEQMPYVAFLGSLEPRKNVPALISGFTAAVSGRADPPALVLAGEQGWDEEISTALAAVPSGLRVVKPGYLPFDVLAGFLGGAEVVAYPSLGEGFGLPVLEAMACGTCVLTTRRLSLPEVGGDAVAYCGTSADAIAAALAELLDDSDRRRTLARAGQRRANDFSWAASARSHLEVYQRATATHSSTT